MRRYLARFAVTALLLVLLVSLSHAAQLPPNISLTIQLSAIDYADQITPVASTTAVTDTNGKFTYSFPVVPSTDKAQFLLLQVFDDENMLRQAIVPAPNNNENVEAGISEISDLQARALLSAKSDTNRLTPIHLFLVQTMLRSPAIQQVDVNKILTAINQAATTFYASLLSPSWSTDWAANTTQNIASPLQSSPMILRAVMRHLSSIGGVPPKGYPGISFIVSSITPEQVAIFNKELLAGLRRAMALYRKSIDDSIAADTSIEIRGRNQAFSSMMREFISASATAGISLDISEWAYMAAGGAAETSLKQQNTTPAVTSLERLCFVNGMTLCQTLRVVRNNTDALSTLGISPPTLQVYFRLLSLLSDRIPSRLGLESTLAQPILSDAHTYEIGIFNTFAARDVAYLGATMDATGFIDGPIDTTEFDTLWAVVVGRMAGTSGVMAGMTASRLGSILGTDSTSPSGIFILPVWLYLQQTPQYTYTPIPGLYSGVNTPPTMPLFDQLSGAYLAQAQFRYDLALVGQLSYQDDVAAENAGYAITPAQWYTLATVAGLKNAAITRRAMVMSRLNGLTSKEADAIMTVSRGIGGFNFY